MSTTFMNLDLPTVSITLGPEWANEVNAALEVIDSHDHTSDKGAKVPTAGLNIDGNLEFNSFKITGLQMAQFTPLGAIPSGASNASGVSVFSGDLYYTNTSGTAVQVTSGGSVVSSPATVQSFETVDVGTNLVISPASTFVYLIVDTTSSRNITLPLANAVTSGRIYILKDKDGQALDNNITLTAAGSDTIDGAATQTLNSNLGTWTVVGDGSSNWYLS